MWAAKGHRGTGRARGDVRGWVGGGLVQEAGRWKTVGARQNGKGSERRVSQPAHGCGEATVAKRERGQRGSSIHGEWEVRGDWQGCILEPDGGDTQAVEVREGRREGNDGTGCNVLWARA